MGNPTNQPLLPIPKFELRPNLGARALYDAEWILPNGLGGFAMGTASGIPRRKYHGWLNAPATPPVDRTATITGSLETLIIDGDRFPLGGLLTEAATPQSITQRVAELTSFVRTPTEVLWTFSVGEVEITKRLRVGWRRNCCAMRYEVRGNARLEVRPLLGVRDFHDVTVSRAIDRLSLEPRADGFCASADGRAIHVAAVGGSYTAGAELIEGAAYDIESSRGMPDREDLVAAGAFALDGPGTMTIACSLAPEQPDPTLFDRDERGKHLAGIVEGMPAKGLDVLVAAADDFLVRRVVDGQPLLSVLAGFPWFADWGRDTMIALPGLMLTTRRFDDARVCLETFARYVSRGMIPNHFDDYGGPPHYNTVDASLWFLHAATEYLRASGDRDGFREKLAPACVEIIEGYRSGTRYDIKMDEADGLIAAGDETTQLTWMDAKRDGEVFTPRHGKAVEIQALWRHGLVRVAEALPDDARSREYRALGERAGHSLIARFADPSTGGFHDCLQLAASGAWVPTGELRPNQIFAASLEHSGLTRERRAGIVRVVRERLLTPVGLRTLAQGEARYQPRFRGEMMARDRAYHNGTVWPWPIGAYCEAALRADNFSGAARAHTHGVVSTLIEHLGSGCLGQICEVYDADEPRDQQGCCAQAWSVAEVLRVLAM